MANAPSPDANIYFVPHSSKWPFVGSIAMFVTMAGVASWLNDLSWGMWTFYAGIAGLCATLFMWFGDVIRESVSGHYNRQVDVSFRMGMVWFIFSEVMFFAAFFGALFYARTLSLPWLGGEGDVHGIGRGHRASRGGARRRARGGPVSDGDAGPRRPPGPDRGAPGGGS